jgi:hypothetical protein
MWHTIFLSFLDHLREHHQSLVKFLTHLDILSLRFPPVEIKVTAALVQEIAEDPGKRAGDSFENY